MKKIIIFFSAMALILCLLSCKNNNAIAVESNKIKIVTTIFPIYDLTKEIIKGVPNIDINLLMQNGIDLHNFRPSAKDLIDIANSDLFVYIGGESDEWVNDALKDVNNKNINYINLMQMLKNDILEEDEDISEEWHNKEEHNNEEYEYDEHIWLSLKNAKKIVNILENNLEKIDSINSHKYKENANALINSIDNLDIKYKKGTSVDGEIMVVFADRFPFKYLFNDYGIKYVAAFNGCSAESEASFEKILTLAKTIDEYNLKNVMILEGSNEKIAKTVIENTKNKNAKILTLNSMQSITNNDIKNGKNYISIMEDNFINLVEAIE